jgi:hypothetical protein
MMDYGSMSLSLLKKQLDAYKPQDPNEIRQKAVPISVLIIKVFHLFSKTNNTMSSACADLIIGASFFVMQSCDYNKTTRPNESITIKLLTLENMNFFKNSFLIPLDSHELNPADITSFTLKPTKRTRQSSKPSACTVPFQASAPSQPGPH